MYTKQTGLTFFALFTGSIFLANYLITHVGYYCDPICVIPVWPGILAPSGVLVIGLSFTLRDLVQRWLGLRWTVAAVIIGAALSAWLSPALALASGTAFLLSELLDLLVYTPLQERRLLAAVVASNVVGLVVDSVVFLLLAFGSLQFVEGQIIGKLWMTAVAVLVIWWLRQKSS